MLISATVLPDLLGPRKIPVHGTRDHGVRGLLTAILSHRKQLDLPHTSFAGKPGSETGINLTAGMRLKYMGSKSRLAPHVDRLLGDVGAILCVAQEWLEQSCCQRRIEAAILCPTQDCQARTRPAPGPHQARARQLEAWARNLTSVWSEVGFPTSVEMTLRVIRGGLGRNRARDLFRNGFETSI